MRKKITITFVGLALFVGSLVAHDTFLRLSTFFVPANTSVEMALITGTWDNSENSVSRGRMADVSIMYAPDRIEHPARDQWKDRRKASWLRFDTENEGTYVVGVSTWGSIVGLSYEDFNENLVHEGLPDILAERTADGELGRPAREKYFKHTKALIQVGDTPSDTYNIPLGYAGELVPLVNPYTMNLGDDFSVQVLKEGKPVPNYLIYASFSAPGDFMTTSDHGHEHAEGYVHPEGEGAAVEPGEHEEPVHSHAYAVTMRTDENGIATFPISDAGIWYVKTIVIDRVYEKLYDYKSHWLTLTFEVAGGTEE